MSIGIGDALREAREAQGRPIEDPAERLRARVSQLAALEEERFEELGGHVYAKGFLRSYALELGIDPEPLLALYRNEVSEDPSLTPLTVSVNAPARASTGRPAWLAWVLAAVVVLAGVSVIGGLGGGRTPDQASSEQIDGPPPAPAPTEREEEEPEETSPQPADPQPAEDPAPEGVDLLLALEAASWLRVIVDGTLVLEQTVQAGETLPFVADQEIEVRFGNAGGVRASLNGEDLGAQGASGQAITVRYTPEGYEAL